MLENLKMFHIASPSSHQLIFYIKNMHSDNVTMHWLCEIQDHFLIISIFHGGLRHFEMDPIHLTKKITPSDLFLRNDTSKPHPGHPNTKHTFCVL